jgi:hypothetical protein
MRKYLENQRPPHKPPVKYANTPVAGSPPFPKVDCKGNHLFGLNKWFY